MNSHLAVRAGRSILLSALALALAAQETAPPPAEKPPLESWAAESKPVPVKQTPGQVRVFDEDDILRSGARTLGAFLIQELPAQIQNEGGSGLPSRAYLGGSRPQDTVVLVDGVPLMDPGRLGQDLNEVPLLGITRIEVITGSAGAGPGGSGGTIALFTGKPLKPGASGGLEGVGGNQGQGQSSATPACTWDGGYLHGGTLAAEEKQPLPTDRPYRQVSNFLGLGQRWGAAVWTLAWRGTYFGTPLPYQNVSDAGLVYNPARESRQRSDSGLVRVAWDLGSGRDLETTLSLARFRHEQPTAGTDVATPFSGRETRLQSVLNLGGGPRSALALRLEGLDASQDGDVDPAVQGRARGSQVAFGLEWRFEPRPGLRLVGQARATRDRQSLALPLGTADVLTGWGHTVRLGLNQELGFGLRLYATTGFGRTAPALLQQLRNAQVPGTAPLDMERTATFQAGFGWGRGNWYGKVEAQQQDSRDLVSPSGAVYVNQARVRARGTEAAFGWRQGKRLGLEAFVRAQEARDLDAPDGQQYATATVERRPFSSHGLKGFVGWSRVRAEVHYTLQGHQYSSFGESGKAAATNGLPLIIRPTQVVYRNVGMSTSLQAGRHWTFVLRGENLLQPTTDASQWLARQRETQSDAFIVDGYPAAPPSYSLEARFRY